MRAVLIHSTIREDEKLLLAAAVSRRVNLAAVDIRRQILNLETWRDRFDVVLERCVSATIGAHAVAFFESIGIPVVNSLSVARICDDKFATSLCLRKNRVPTIPFAMAFTEAEALEAVNQLGGYPVVLKPVGGSWGRLLAKVNDHDALEAVIEQKMILGSHSHKALYIQKYILKPGRDIRVITAGGQAVGAIYRAARHWITNTARGAEAQSCRIDKKLEQICADASRAIGGGVLGIDIFETGDGYVVNEINRAAEFKNVQRVTGIDIAGAIIEYCINL
ncbi:MAG: lysine biosynthesis protein LysX [Candidatus Magasanikbacteria bacterium]|nr:lysine biosynthesis protein LysX [Candidatus Magasanikbacteria bacterium]